jgi:hypothetical protein
VQRYRSVASIGKFIHQILSPAKKEKDAKWKMKFYKLASLKLQKQVRSAFYSSLDLICLG